MHMVCFSSMFLSYLIFKEYGWGLSQAMEHVKKKRDCITPNKGFVEQLKTFEGDWLLRNFFWKIRNLITKYMM